MRLRSDLVSSAPALSIRQPWAEAIVSGRKSIEIRNWTTRYRGPVWVHAAKHAAPHLLEMETERSCLYRGGVVGIVSLEAVVSMTPERWELWRDQHLATGDYPSGTFAWLLTEQHRLPRPVSVEGSLKLFNLPENTLRELLTEFAQLEGPLLGS